MKWSWRIGELAGIGVYMRIAFRRLQTCECHAVPVMHGGLRLHETRRASRPTGLCGPVDWRDVLQSISPRWRRFAILPA